MTTPQSDQGAWSLLQDLSGLLDVENNFIVGREIRNAIEQQDVHLLARLESDPDADFVSIAARVQADIWRVARLIQTKPAWG